MPEVFSGILPTKIKVLLIIVYYNMIQLPDWGNFKYVIQKQRKPLHSCSFCDKWKSETRTLPAITANIISRKIRARFFMIVRLKI